MTTAVITGGARGIGRAIAFDLLARGIRQLAITARTEDELYKARDALTARGATVLAFQADVRDAGAMQRVVDASLTYFGQIDAWINNAGVAVRRPFAEMKPEEWDEITDTNVKGVFVCTRLVLPHMLARRSGVIINVASGAGKVGFPELSVYCASKFAVVGFSESLAREVKDYGVRVYAVCPGSTDTRMYRSLFPERKPVHTPEAVARVVGKLVVGEVPVTPEYCIDV